MEMCRFVQCTRKSGVMKMCWCCCYIWHIFICFPLLLLLTFFTLCHPYIFFALFLGPLILMLLLLDALCFCHCWCCFCCSWSPSCCQFFFRNIFFIFIFFMYSILSSFEMLYLCSVLLCFRMDFCVHVVWDYVVHVWVYVCDICTVE